MLTGGCYCGDIRYEVTGAPFDATICHCSDCRRVAAAPMVAWFSVARDEFRVVHGEPKSFRSSERAVRGFCAACGTPLTFRADATPDVVDVLTVTLDDASAIAPQDHVWTAGRLPWVKISDGLPCYEHGRPEPEA